MLLLAIDTCFGSCSAALYDLAAQTIVGEAQCLMETGQAEALGPMVAELFQASGRRADDVARVAVTRGPGTFTGLRIGLSFAHGFATGRSCDVVGLDSLTATAAPLLASVPRLAVIQRAGATGKHYAALLRDGVRSVGPSFLALDELSHLAGAETFAALGSGADDAAGSMPSQFTRLAGYDLPRAAAFAPFAARLPQAAGFPEPLYLRETDAKPSAQTSAPVTRLATSDDLPVLARLHGTCFEAGWNEASLAASLSLPGAMGLVVVADGAVRGFILTQAAADECEILTLCTEPRWRKKGLARRLVEASLQLHKAQAARTMHLEVAADNTAAQALYGSCGFMETGRRKAYYARKNAAAVDAILMSRGL